MRNAVRVFAVATTVLFASAAFGGDAPKAVPKKDAPPAKVAVEAPAASQGGMVVFVDPATGKVRQPTAEEIGQLLALQKPAPAAPPKQFRNLPNGGKGTFVDPSLDSYAVATKSPDGKLVMSCVDGQEKAEQTVVAGTAVPAKGALDEK